MRSFFIFTIVGSIMLSQLSEAAPLPRTINDVPMNLVPAEAAIQRVMDVSPDDQVDLKTSPYADPFTYLQSVITPNILAFHARNLGITITSFVFWLLDRKHPSLETFIFSVVLSSTLYGAKISLFENNLEINFKTAAIATGIFNLIVKHLIHCRW
jgi:hypothetical protein